MKRSILKRTLLNVWYIAPILVTLGTLMYFGYMYNDYRHTLTESLYNEQVVMTRKIIDELDVITADKDSVNRDDYEKYLISLVESIDNEHAVYARVYDISGKRISTANSAVTEPAPILLDADFENPEKIIKQIQSRPTGDTVLTMKDGNQMKLHWFSYPKNNTSYYILIGIVPDRLLQVININTFTYGLLGIIIFMLICAYYNIYLIHKRTRHKCKEGVE